MSGMVLHWNGPCLSRNCRGFLGWQWLQDSIYWEDVVVVGAAARGNSGL